MNLRMDGRSFRFRISPEELGRLLVGRDLDESVCIDIHRFGYRIIPAGDAPEMRLAMADGGFCLYVPGPMLEELRGMGRSKEGLKIMQDGIELALQVDIKTQARKVA